MLIIHCPDCGARDYTEFRYGGDANRPRPAHDEPEAAVWHDHVFIFDNPKGPHREYWQHVLGCREWLVVERNTASNTVIAVRRARDSGSQP